MKLTWIGHSCFKIENDQCSVVLDPYSPGSVPGLLPAAAQADLVICSHEHGDHNGREQIETPENIRFPIFRCRSRRSRHFMMMRREVSAA